MTQRIMELARTVGHVSNEENDLLSTLCQAAQQELARALKPGVVPEDCAESFVLAGAWLALAGLEVSRGAGQVQSFHAGDVTIHGGQPAQKAQMLKEQAWKLMAPWTQDRNFLFYGVRGL